MIANNTSLSSARTPKIDLHCAGSPYEMGLAQGKQLKSKIEASVEILQELEALNLDRPFWLPFKFYRILAQYKVGKFWSTLGNSMPDYSQRLKGISIGSGVNEKSIMLLNALEPLMASLDGKTVNAPIGACSSVAIRGDKSANSNALLAHNFDYLPALQQFYILRECKPTNGYRALEFGLAPLAGAVDGINEHGLSISYDYAYIKDEGESNGTISMAVSEALRTCKHVTEAIAQIESTPRWGGGILMLADAKGDIASLELSNTKSAVRRPEDKLDYLAHSNQFFTKEMQEVEVPIDAHYSKKSPITLRGKRVLESSELRDERYTKLLEEANNLDSDSLKEIFSDHGPDGTHGRNSICMHSDYWSTTATLQLIPETRTMRVAYNSACKAEFVDFSL